jgi:hypothetical protein
MASEEVLTNVACPRHPAVATGLRCARCGTPICPRCLVQAPVGARCPDCAKPTGGIGARPSLRQYVQSGAAGLASAVVAGALVAIVPLGLLSFFAPLLIGYLVGEAVARTSHRLPYRELAVVAFVCALVGPMLGRAALLLLIVPTADPTLRAILALSTALQSIGPFGLLMGVLAGVVAARRVTG